jgi:hypothetical protein
MERTVRATLAVAVTTAMNAAGRVDVAQLSRRAPADGTFALYL